MRESLRARLLLWHIATVAAVITVFATSIGFLTWRTRVSDIDSVLSIRLAQLSRAVTPTSDGRIDLILGPGLRYEDAPEFYHVVWTPDGTAVDRSDATLPIPRPEGIGPRTREGRRELAIVTPTGVQILAGRDLAEVRRDVWALASKLIAIGIGILLVSSAVGWWLVGRALDPLDRINRTARRMTGGDLAARIVVDAPNSEVGQLGHALNSAFDRLQEAVDRQRRFTADASHELRTPLTTLSTEVQWALNRPRTADELRSSLEVSGRAVGRMQSVIERLLQLARGETPPRAHTRVLLHHAVEQAVDAVRALATASKVTLQMQIEPADIQADADQVREAITNVLANAIRYNVEEGRVNVALHRQDDRIELAVSDNGIGIAPADLPFVFEPFFRGDPARSRDTGGAGLGLAVARAIVEQSAGTMQCESTPGAGTRITIRWLTSGSSPDDRSN